MRALISGAVAIAAIVGVAVWFAARRGDGNTNADPAMTDPGRASGLPSIPFTDITDHAGIRFVHTNGAAGEKLLPETMGGGCAFFDYDDDGLPDLLLVNSKRWTDADGPQPTSALYHNDGNGRFTDVTAGSGLDVSLYGMGAAVGDYDNDGRTDLFITAVGGNRLFRNLGAGKFADVTASAGVAGDGGWSTGAAFVDINNDGRLDLFVCDYVRWDRQSDVEQGFVIPGVGRAYGPPLAFGGTYCRLYRGNADGTFSDVSAASGILINEQDDAARHGQDARATRRPAAKALAVAPVDLDGDWWIDLVVANDTRPNFVFHNKGDGTFEEVGVRAGMAFNLAGDVRGAMGVDAAFFRNDGGQTLGVAVGNFAGEINALYVNQGPSDAMVFQDEAMQTGVGAATHNVLTFGLFFFDADLDGRQDLLMAQGHIEPQIDTLRGSQTYRQPAILLWNTGVSGARAVPGLPAPMATAPHDFMPLTTAQCGPEFFKPLAARGAAYADIDRDGDLDVLITQVGDRPRLLRNDQQLGHRWLRLRLEGDPSQNVNRDAIGAWVEAIVGGRVLRRQVMPTCSYLSQVERVVTIGLGPHDAPERLSVLWPGGRRQDFAARVGGETAVRQGR